KDAFRKDLLAIARTTLSSKVLSQDRDHFASLACDAVLRLRGSTDLSHIQIIKKAGGKLNDSYLDEGFILDKRIGVNQPKRLENAKILVANTAMDTDKVKIFGARVKVDSTGGLAKLEEAEREKMKQKVEKIKAHGINCFVNRQLIYNRPEQLFSDAGIVSIEHADFDGIERLALVTGGEIASTFDHPDMVKLGHCDLIEEVMIGEDTLIKFSGVAAGQACTIVLRGATEQLLDEADRSLHDALAVLSQTVREPKTTLGGGCAEMVMAKAVEQEAPNVAGKKAIAVEAFAAALRQLPTILADNAGFDSSDLIAKLKKEIYNGRTRSGLDLLIPGGGIADMREKGVIESYKLKRAVVSSAAEAAELLLRVDSIKKATDIYNCEQRMIGGFYQLQTPHAELLPPMLKQRSEEFRREVVVLRLVGSVTRSPRAYLKDHPVKKTRRNGGAGRLVITALTATLLILPVFAASPQHEPLHHRRSSHEAGPPGHRHPSGNDPSHHQPNIHDPFKNKHVKDTRSTPERVSAIATTVAPAGNDPAVRAVRPARGSGSSAGISSPQIARSLQDWEVEDFILLATVDGSIYARERKTGAAIWHLEVEKPMVETIYHPQNESVQSYTRSEYDWLWIVEPSRDGDIYIYNHGRNGGLRRLHMTVKQLVEDMSPFESVDPAVVYNAEKKTRLFTIDAETGTVIKNFGSGGAFSKADESCPRNPAFAGVDEECGSSGSFVLGRTEYTVTISNRNTAEPICTLMYSEWGPNTRDSDLHSQYSTTMDNKYVYSLHDGSIFGWDHGQILERQRSYTQKLSSPVVRVFDVARPLNVEEKDPQLIILPQPVGPIDKENIYNSFANQNRIFVNHTEAGGWFAMSESSYPLVTGRAKTAQCYDPEWLDFTFTQRPTSLSQKQESFVGVHSLANMENWPGSGLTISGPPLDAVDQLPAGNNAITAPLQSATNIGKSRIVTGAKENFVDIGIMIIGGFFILFVYVNRRLFSRSLKKLEINANIPIVDQPTASVPPSPMVAEAPWTQEPLPGAMEKVEEVLEMQDEQAGSRLRSRSSTLLEPPKDLTRSRSNSVEEERGRTNEERNVRFQEPSPGPEEDDLVTSPQTAKKKARRGVRGGKNRKKRSNSKHEQKDSIDQTGDEVLQISPEPQIEPKVTQVIPDGATDVIEIAAGTIQIGHLKVFTDTVLGHGSHGTVVYKGSFGGRDVAVKRMLSNFFDIAAHEVGLLQESDDHQNVIRYYDKEVTGDFLYIALELCPASLQDVVEKPAAYPSLTGPERLDPISALKQIASGLQHLHSLKIVHRDIKPQNILVAAPKLVPTNPSASQPSRLLISDFGLCKKLEGDQNSFRATTAHAAGTSGWRAPELLVDEDLLPNTNNAIQVDPLKPQTQAVSNTSEPLVLDPSTNRRATRAIDIFSLGCVFYYVLTNGCHPYDKDGKFMREANIVKGLYDISNLALLGDYQWEAKDLIASMLDHNPRVRPDAASVLTHPFFWPPAERLEFLCHVSDAFEFEPRDPPSQALMQLEDYSSIIMAEAPRGDFLLALPREFRDTLGKQRKYTGTKVLDLLRALRNKKHHYEDIPENVKEKIGSFPVGYLEFWARRFPSLLMATWRCVAERTTESPESYHTYSSLVDAQYSEPRADFWSEADRQAQLNEIAERQYRDWPKSSYTDVTCLLLKWADDNLGVLTEVKNLERIWRDRFNFSTEIWDIPSEDPEDNLTDKILKFRRGISSTTLVIVYYAGHGGDDPQECMWYATNAPDSPELNWHNVQSHLLGHPPDVLLILDCCFAGLAVTDRGRGDNWFLGASVKEAEATGVSWKSFTSAMSRQLELAADSYWSYKRTYNVQTLKTDLNVWERHHHLPVSPDLTRLTAHDCPPTDLTPLLYRRQRPKLASANTEPVANEPAQQSPTPSGPRRPRQGHATLPPQPTSSTMNPINGGDLGSQPMANIIPIEIDVQDTQTIRISGLPWDAKEEDVESWFKSKLRPGLVKVTVGQVVENSTFKTAIATFSNIAVAKRALQIIRREFPDRAGQHTNLVDLDSSFRGFTTIYAPSQDPSHEPNVDIVLVHGASGHPFNSFASHHLSSVHGASSTERCWPRDELPRLLQAGGVFPRIMTYGWPAEIWLNPHGNTSDCTEAFLLHLRSARQAAPKRPLVFIGHGLGGILIKEAVSGIINAGFAEDDFENPTRACIFLAVPHRPASTHEDFTGILEGMKAMLLGPEPAAHPPTTDLGSRSGALRNISTEFDIICHEYSICLLSLGEATKTDSHLVIPESSAFLTETPENQIKVDGGYRDVARLPTTVQNRQAVLDKISETIIHSVVPPKSFNHTEEVEEVFARLQMYDTEFIIDNSTSMGSPHRWKTVQKVLDKIVSIAVKYDQDGVDVRFLNGYLPVSERTNLNSSEKVMALFSKVEARGPTLMADILEEELNEYMKKYREDSDVKGLNLIVLTDGEPERGQRVDKVIVEYANELRDLKAHKFKIGIQFVQIGNDAAATKFLDFVDKKLKNSRKLDRDMVDTVRWVPGQEEYLFEKILLGGILKRYDDDDEEDSESSGKND
ncbi:MAG: hypothetical protein Q9218_005411, partial [Villophora microphyllina]